MLHSVLGILKKARENEQRDVATVPGQAVPQAASWQYINVGVQYIPLGKTTQSRGCPISNHNNLTNLPDNGTYKSFPLGIWDKSKAISSRINVFVNTKALNP